MSDDGYRDALGAAQSRIEALERENAALKDLQNGRPATAAEVEAVRLETELVRADTEWQTRLRSRGRDPGSRAVLGSAVFLGLIVPMVGALTGVARYMPNSSAIFFSGLTLAAIIAGTIAYLVVSLKRATRAYARELAAHNAKRARVAGEIEKLRGGHLRIDTREPAVADAVELEESGPADEARSRTSG